MGRSAIRRVVEGDEWEEKVVIEKEGLRPRRRSRVGKG